MQENRVYNAEQALVYIADCCLATVCSMATVKRKPKHEFKRQIAIAQKACDWIKTFGIDPQGTRVEDIILGKQTVEVWAAQFTQKNI
jgi:hypothetical protein